MKRILRVIVALVVSAALMCGVCFNAAAFDEASARLSFGKVLSEGFSGLATALIRGIASFIPDPGWQDKDEYVSENFFEGTGGTVQGDSWYCGFASQSLVPDDIESGRYTSAGYFSNFPGNYLGGVLDDQRIAAVSLGTGGQTVVFISIDGFGMSGTNVRKIRERLADFAAENSIKSINVTLSHSHYCIDTHGLGTDIAKALKFNFMSLLTRKAEKYESTNPDFMNALFSAAEAVTRQAVSGMSAGTLSYGGADITDLLRDGQLPTVFDSNVNRLRFVPDDEDKNEIWLVNMGGHPTMLPQDTKQVSADYPGAVVRYAKQLAGADAAFFQGAQCGVSVNAGSLPIPADSDRYVRMRAYGEEIVRRMLAITNESEISPKLNVRHKELFVPIENAVLQVACRAQMINNTLLHTTGRLRDTVGVTEIGYCELGDSVAIVLAPGEISPEIIFGGTKDASQSWSRADWKYEPLEDRAGSRKVLCFGLTNDQIGYIVPDNDYANTFAQLFEGLYGDNNSHYQEMISAGKHTASALTAAYLELI